MLTNINGQLEYPIYQNHTVFFLHEDELYVGGTDFVLKIDVDDNRIIEEFPLKTTAEQEECSEGPCENVVTVIEKFQDNLFVCGTNGYRPQCWKMVNDQPRDVIVESYEGRGISPYVYSQNSLSITVEGDLYAAAPLNSDGSSLQFRRKAGNRTNVWMYDKWVLEPTFISASWIKRREDPDNEKIYVFLREKNSDDGPEADPWISRVARVCKVDEGGSKRFFQNMWTSFLKARLVCGFPEESLYFNRLQDIYVLHAEDWRETRVYALFTSSWNSTAVCIYSIADIDEIFETSTFKGYNQDIPNPRPGTCVKNSKTLPLATINVVKGHPEVSDWVRSIDHLAPFFVSSSNYTKIAVDRVQAADQRMYNVLLLATDSGKIHKVLEAGTEAFIISETQLSNNSAIQSMELDSKKRKLIVGFSEQIYSVDLQRCQDYNASCEDCVLARDPYCAWTKFGCTPTVPGGIQNITGGQINVCLTAEEEPNKMNRTKRETPSPPPVDVQTVHSVPLEVPFYLSCPIDSYHAVYIWEHQDQHSPCLQMQSNCLHLIPAMTEESYGDYKCISKERDYTKVVTGYRLTKQTILDTNSNTRTNVIVDENNSAVALVPQMAWVMSVAVVLGLFN
ncbi:semaphorin-7A [Diretmus argenteus]